MRLSADRGDIELADGGGRRMDGCMAGTTESLSRRSERVAGLRVWCGSHATDRDYRSDRHVSQTLHCGSEIMLLLKLTRPLPPLLIKLPLPLLPALSSLYQHLPQSPSTVNDTVNALRNSLNTHYHTVSSPFYTRTI